MQVATQAPDVVWNACFESYMPSSFDTWLSEPFLDEYTKGGNIKPPQRSLVCEWVKYFWEGPTTSTSGYDEDKIHCFKSGQLSRHFF
jgi:hypothetical protein